MSPSHEQHQTSLLMGFQLNLDLEPIPTPNLRRAVHLDSLIKQLPRCKDGGPGVGVSDTQVARLRAELQACHGSLDQLSRLFARVRKPHLWFAVYAADHLLPDAQNYLPTFDQPIAKAILGEATTKRDTSSLRQALRLYFMAFGKQGMIQKSGLEVLRDWIQQELPHHADGRIPSLSTLSSNRWLFADDGPIRLAEKIPTPADLERICDEHRVPREGGFFSAVRDEVLLLRLRQAHPSATEQLIDQIYLRKRDRTTRGRCLGAEALEILISRVRSELQADWPEHWLDAILRVSCHPEVPRTTPDYQNFWHWAERADIDLAMAGLAKRNIEKFLEILDKQYTEFHQYEYRKVFLRHLLHHKKIRRVKLILPPNVYRVIPQQSRDPYSMTVLSRDGDQSVICLQCTDGVNIVEGTQDFAIGVFINREIPIYNLWSHTLMQYDLNELRTSRLLPDCRKVHHDSGSWMNDVIKFLRTRNIEWPLIRR
jgi:hypothetical protein